MKTPIRNIPQSIVAEAIALLRKPCDCCERPWTVKALAERYGVGRITLMRAMHEYEVQAPLASNTSTMETKHVQDHD